MIDHNFADPDTLSYYYGSCQTDPNSAGCRYFNMRLEEDTDELNPYSNCIFYYRCLWVLFL